MPTTETPGAPATANGRQPRRYVVCTVDELPPGERKIVELDSRSVGVFNVNGSFYALHNRCPHQAAPLCKGRLYGNYKPSAPYVLDVDRDGEILRCPWHGWEFDLTNGHSVFNPHRVRARAYPVSVEPACGSAAPVSLDEPDPSVETFPVTIERELVVVYI
jgi:nitrite reductase (NADH) small subunit